MVAPLVLLYVQASGDLVPLAIQLKQEPGDNNPIWTVHDHDENWILAKLWVRCADFQVGKPVCNNLKCIVYLIKNKAQHPLSSLGRGDFGLYF